MVVVVYWVVEGLLTSQRLFGGLSLCPTRWSCLTFTFTFTFTFFGYGCDARLSRASTSGLLYVAKVIYFAACTTQISCSRYASQLGSRAFGEWLWGRCLAPVRRAHTSAVGHGVSLQKRVISTSGSCDVGAL